MTNVLPVRRENCADKGRANASVPLPAGNGTIKLTGLMGQRDCAWLPSEIIAAEGALDLTDKSPLRHWLLRCAAHYLGQAVADGKPLDAVARFHLGNGARVERLNWAGDPSPKGLRQSYGLMVNYLYDLKRLDKHRSLLAHGKIPVSGSIEDLYI